MRVALIGYGAVAAIHARKLQAGGVARGVTLSAVCGPDRAIAEAFAAEHGYERAVTDLDAALDHADAVVIASPSPRHYEQGLQTLDRGVAALIELPACASGEEAAQLAQTAAKSGVLLQCAHTSRYLEPYRRIGEWIREGRLGGIRHAHYFRSIPPRSRSWRDDALLHHAAHPLDLLLHWLGTLTPLGCAAAPTDRPQDVSVLAQLPGGGPATIAISYTGRLSPVRMTIIGSHHTVETDGFSFIRSDDAELVWTGDERETYEQAIGDQDFAFLRRCQTGSGGIDWEQTLRLIRNIDEFKKLCTISKPVL